MSTPLRTHIVDVLVIGGGPAGLAAAISAKKNGAQRVLLLERATSLGGILNQCIHNGFGLHQFKEELTGPEYAERFIAQLPGSGVEVLCGATVLGLEAASRQIWAVHPQQGFLQLQANAIVLAMGCRERTRGAIGIAGSRPAGVFTAGAAQLYMNIEGFHIGRKVVILGSGDIGLIMARRLCLEGAEVEGVYELMPHSGGLMRNIVQCLHDFSIPLHLSHTITEIHGDTRVTGITVQQVGPDCQAISGTERHISCDTVLLSVGLLPENELSRAAGLCIDPRTGGPAVYENMECSMPGIFACGNVAHVHDLVDFVTAESVHAGTSAAVFCEKPSSYNNFFAVLPGDGLGYVLPQKIRINSPEKNIHLFFRVNTVFGKSAILVKSGDKTIAKYKREHMAPGEMEQIQLPRKLLDNLPENTLKLLVEAGCPA